MPTETKEQRTKRIFEEDEYNRQQAFLKEETSGLLERQQKRLAIITKYKEELDAMISGKPKGLRFRKYFHNFVFVVSTKIFQTENDEYNCIGKAGRESWTEYNELKKFNKEERKIIDEIIREFGCYDY